MGQAERPTCPKCGAKLIVALPPGGKGQRTLQYFDCDRPDPLKTDKAAGLAQKGSAASTIGPRQDLNPS
jgi:hypothetical protein